MNELDKAFTSEDKIPLKVVPFNKAAGTVNTSPSTNPLPPLVAVTDEIVVSESKVKFKTAPIPDNDPVAPTDV